MSNAVGSYLRHVQNPANEDTFNKDTRRALDGEKRFDDDSPRFEDWSAAKQRAAYEGLERAEDNKIKQRANADAFLASHAEFIDIDANGQTMNRTLEALYGDRVYTVDEFEKAYEVCRANNSLKIDLAEEAKQQQRAADAQRKTVVKQRQERERLRNLSEDELNALPLEELRALVERQQHEDMQHEGERGGLGL
jgi:hypothetical protein